MSDLCKKLQIDKVQTSPYHPQTNGCLERWHGTLNNMIKKCMTCKLDWARQIKYVLFAYRCAPHSNTGLSPFQIIYGRNMHGPLDVIAEGWQYKEQEEVRVCEWVEQLGKQLEALRDIMRKKESEVKGKMKADYDRKAKVREFNVGSMVMIRIPGMNGKLEDSWDGPYEVGRRVGKVNYEVIVPGKKSKKKIIHVNTCKQWYQADAKVLRIVVMTEDEEEEKYDKTKLSGRKLEEEKKKELQRLLDEYKDVLRSEPGLTNRAKHIINTGDSLPCRTYPYRLCPAQRLKIKEAVRELLEAKIIEPSASPWTSPMVPVKKSDGSIRLCIDFRKVNSVTVPDPYDMPLIEDLLDQVGEAVYLSKLDLTKGFYQIPLEAHDRDKTSFCTPWGKFRFTRMPFGLRNAPATFQRMMHDVLRGQEEHAASYIDDSLVYSLNWEEHLAHIKAVLEALRQSGLTAKPAKCQWGSSKLEYLGHIVGEGKVEVPQARVKAIKEFKRPETKRQLQAFLGTTGYHRKFIRSYADHSANLTVATRKTAPNRLEWTEAMCDDFCYLCTTLCDCCTLTLPCSKDVYVLQTDASGVGISGILSVCRNGQELPVAFYSRQLRGAEKRYTVTEIECLAVLSAIKHFEVYLHGIKFTVETDHKALEQLLSSNHLNARLTRWALYLQQFSMTIHYRPGSKNQNADGLSRQAWNTADEDVAHFEKGGDVRM